MHVCSAWGFISKLCWVIYHLVFWVEYCHDQNTCQLFKYVNGHYHVNCSFRLIQLTD